MSVAYAKTTVPDEMFTAARVQMETMVSALRSDKMLSAQHSDVESLVQTQGRELERLLYQAHLDLRAACERPVPVCGKDGVERPYRRHSGRPLGTVLGRVMVARLAEKDEIRSAWISKHPEVIDAEKCVKNLQAVLDAVPWSKDAAEYFKSR